ncbi:hypothetical protein ACFQ1M_15940 [Sungkyunkwania multivorans]|uniref:Uncharacterized protein n=1 Tax=Sungkyunkwania multivorans TaxID=1173618 RepID=A0ABW3D0Y5_9FLAO
MNKNKNKEIAIGIITGIIATGVGVLLYLTYVSIDQDLSIATSFDTIVAQERVGSLFTLGAIPNLLAFFGFLKIKRDMRAKGVLIITIVLAILMLVYKLL